MKKKRELPTNLTKEQLEDKMFMIKLAMEYITGEEVTFKTIKLEDKKENDGR